MSGLKTLVKQPLLLREGLAEQFQDVVAGYFHRDFAFEADLDAEIAEIELSLVDVVLAFLGQQEGMDVRVRIVFGFEIVGGGVHGRAVGNRAVHGDHAFFGQNGIVAAEGIAGKFESGLGGLDGVSQFLILRGQSHAVFLVSCYDFFGLFRISGGKIRPQLAGEKVKVVAPFDGCHDVSGNVPAEGDGLFHF